MCSLIAAVFVPSPFASLMQIVQIGLKRRVTPGSMLMIAYSSWIGVPSLHLQQKGTGNQFHHLERSIFSFFPTEKWPFVCSCFQCFGKKLELLDLLSLKRKLSCPFRNKNPIRKLKRKKGKKYKEIFLLYSDVLVNIALIGHWLSIVWPSRFSR